MEPTNDTSGTLLKDALANFSNLEEQRPQVLVCIITRGDKICKVGVLPISRVQTKNKVHDTFNAAPNKYLTGIKYPQYALFKKSVNLFTPAC